MVGSDRVIATDKNNLHSKLLGSATAKRVLKNLASGTRPSLEDINVLLEQVADPEIPVLTIADIGVLRSVFWRNEQLVVTITPTYTGCPAVQTFIDDILSLLSLHGLDNAVVEIQLAPAWTTDWLTESGIEKLRNYGIAPPVEGENNNCFFASENPMVVCPRCHSHNTREISSHGSTACKALYQCGDCQEPFDYFKPI